MASTDALTVVQRLLDDDEVHKRLRLTRPFYDRFTPAIGSGDFALRPDRLQAALDFLAVLRP